MTKQEALEEGFVYEGWIGIVPIYITDLHAFGHKNPGLTGKNGFCECALDLQFAINKGVCAVINFFKPGTAEGFPIMFGPRLDGKPVTQEELD